jgi:chitin disaccharide deacetylase
MKYLIVNADDFGASRGVNRGIIEAHCDGVLTSTSLMVDMPAAEEAALLSRDHPALSIGLHIVLTDEAEAPTVDFNDPNACRSRLWQQFQRFEELMDRPPTHLDSHHNRHRDPRLLPLFAELAEEHALPLREHSRARYFSNFYGQWDGQTHLEQIGVENLLRMLQTELRTEVTELSCHPGYVDPDFHSLYGVEREAELRTLCDPALKRFLLRHDVTLIGFNDLSAVPPQTAAV